MLVPFPELGTKEDQEARIGIQVSKEKSLKLSKFLFSLFSCLLGEWNVNKDEATRDDPLWGDAYHLETGKKATHHKWTYDLSDWLDISSLWYWLTWAASSVMTWRS